MEKKYSPWGKIQHSTNITPWMLEVSTASHGGIKVDRKHNSLIPKEYRRKSGWYEEDCDWIIVYRFLGNSIMNECFDKSRINELYETEYISETFNRYVQNQYT